eukprot:1157930-Pelagomonas_calceolata.AAC.12
MQPSKPVLQRHSPIKWLVSRGILAGPDADYMHSVRSHHFRTAFLYCSQGLWSAMGRCRTQVVWGLVSQGTLPDPGRVGGEEWLAHPALPEDVLRETVPATDINLFEYVYSKVVSYEKQLADPGFGTSTST